MHKLARVLPVQAAAALRTAALTRNPRGDSGARQRAIEHAIERVRSLYPDRFHPEPEPEPEPHPDPEPDPEPAPE